MARDVLTVTDQRTGKQYELRIEHGAIRATDLSAIKVSTDDPGLVSYDPAFTNTAPCKSRISFIDGEKGTLHYRGYAIEDLAARSNFLETAYLIVKGELPDSRHFAMWKQNITVHSMVHENVKKFMDGFRYDAEPLGVLVGTVGALSTFYPDAKNVVDLESRRLQTRRLIGKLPTLAAFAYRRTRGLPYIYPDNDLSYTGNFLSMLFRMTELQYQPDPVFEHALDVMFILHADHEVATSTNALRCVASSQADPFSAVAAGVAALYGPRYGGASERVIALLEEIGSVAKVPAFIKQVKDGRELFGFGHPVYRSYDPRAKIAKQLAIEVALSTRKSPLIDIALELERVALQDDYFMSRRLYPNLEFFSGLVYQAMGLPITMFPVLFAIARTAGWMAHWAELVRDPEQSIARPRQIYLGEGPRAFVAIEQRQAPSMREDAVSEKI
ncbi:MAG: citrate synthase [Deltaproteobacteria bacterium]|nr:citrate synthase [Deltaproteobacteria bacterium]MBI3386192.1 citrate synthase [Deltaproteobacteria bacterium]